MKINLDKEPFVKIGNPKTTECEALRISLLPGILKTVAANKHISLPLRMFEVTVPNLYYQHHNNVALFSTVRSSGQNNLL